MNTNHKARLICYYLPQFHPIPENDSWWGKGFTEWTNVAKAKPLFKGHYQPRVPADLGFYDLRVPETRIAQAELAREHGIDGFCYWHYWFAGKRLIDRPFNEVLRSGKPNFPFCLGWANESWTGIWHGCPGKILMEQTYPGAKDEESHFYTVLDAFGDDRYMTVEGKPVFYVYKPQNLLDPIRFTEHWRELAVKEGLKGLYFIGENHMLEWNPHKCGFDACVPHKPGVIFYKLDTIYMSKMRKIFRDYYRKILNRPNIYSYGEFINCAQEELSKVYDHFPSIIPNWDNTPRSGVKGYLLKNSTPELFRVHLKDAIQRVENNIPDKRIIFIKSWNEWAEGNHLEPDLKFGKAYLEVCREEVFSGCVNLK